MKQIIISACTSALINENEPTTSQLVAMKIHVPQRIDIFRMINEFVCKFEMTVRNGLTLFLNSTRHWNSIRRLESRSHCDFISLLLL